MARSKRSKSQGSAHEDPEERGANTTPESSKRSARSSPSKEHKNKSTEKNKTSGQQQQRKRKASHDTAATTSTVNSDNNDHPTNEERELVPEPTKMDVSVHRLRHLQYMPQPILCMRGTPSSTNSSDDDYSNENNAHPSYLAISRDSGSVELKSPQEKFRTVAEIAGFKNKPVHVMTWICGCCFSGSNNDHTKSTFKQSNGVRPTLVGGSRDGSLFVVDFQSGGFMGMTASGGGGVFALASLCQHTAGACSGKHQSCAQLVAAGCEDGSIRIFKVASVVSGNTGNKRDKTAGASHRRELELVSILPSGSGAAILSLAWRRLPGGNNNAGCAGTVVYAGLADGTIRRYVATPDTGGDSTTTTGFTWKSSLRMTVENQGRSIPTKVWALQALQDGTIISGDSLGHVQFWDGATGTMLQSFDQNDNKADVLDLVVASGECKVFASGVDSRVVCIQRSPINITAKDDDMEDDRKWILSQAQRPHTHDVKAMSICRQRVGREEEDELEPEDEREKELDEDSDGWREVLCTGGIDTKLCVYSVERFKHSRPKSLYPWPAFSPVAQARQARVVLIRREGKIDLYQLGRQPSAPVSEAYEVPEDEAFLGTIEVDSTCNLVCATISDDGMYLAACDALSLLLFRLQYVRDQNGVATAIIPTKLSTSTKLKSSIVCMQFGLNDQLVAASSDGSLTVIGMPIDETSIDVTMSGDTIKQKKVRWGGEETLFPTQSIEFSSDKKWFVAVRGGMGSSSVRVFSCEEDVNIYRHWWSVPDLEAPFSAVGFLDGSPQLVVACANFAFYVFDIQQRKLIPWSEECGVPISKHLPSELVGRNDYPIRITSNPASPSRVLLGSFGSFTLIDLEKTSPKFCKYVPQHHVRRWRKRKRSSEAAQTAKCPDDVEATICLRYNSILHMDFIDKNEMVVVEQPWLSVIATFPPALERKLYGS